MKKYLEKLKATIKNMQTDRRLAVFVCIPLGICAAILFAILIGGKESEADISKEVIPSEQRYENQVSSSTYSPSSPRSLEFQSLGNGTCLVMGIGNYKGTELEIPEKSPAGDKVIGIGNGAFEDCRNLVSVSIPYTVTSIGSGVFKGCKSLVMISVDISNEKFSSLGGVLYSKDKSILICCPAARIGYNLLLHSGVRVIEDYAFDGNSNIALILYEKSPSDFFGIKVGEGNENFSSLPVTCNYVPSK